jgi:hypothetical protein
MPNASSHIPDNSPAWDHIEKRAQNDFGGKISAYIRSLIERDMSGQMGNDGMSASILVDLTRQLLGEPAAENMAALCPSSLSQPRELRLILERYLQDREVRNLMAAEDPARYGQPVELKPLMTRGKTGTPADKLSGLIGDKLLKAERERNKDPIPAKNK